MRKIVLLVLVLLLSASLAGCTASNIQNQVNDTSLQNDAIDQQAVMTQVVDFGKKLSMVSLQAPTDIVAKSIQENYGAYVSTTLMDAWVKDPSRAPGRLTSSPWPDRIEVLNSTKVSVDTYEVKGEIIEITSQETINGGAVSKHPITLVVKKIDNRWLIDAVRVSGDPMVNDAITYLNTQYGFNFSLPMSWKGYTIVKDEWKGIAVGDPQNKQPLETGKMISIRHPQWTAQKPRQDIPIMIFAISQWNSLQKGDYHIGAAPIRPSELTRNARYVFALPARYNYAFPTGYEEVERILATKPLKAIEYVEYNINSLQIEGTL